MKILTGILAGACLAAPAMAETGAAPQPEFDQERGFYVAVRGYGSIGDQNNLIFDDSREVAGAVGWRPHHSLRLEAEYAFRWANIVGLNGASTARGDFTSRSLGMHAFYDFRHGKRLRPFVGAGGGAGIQDFDFTGPADINPDFIVVGKDTNMSPIRIRRWHPIWAESTGSTGPTISMSAPAGSFPTCPADRKISVPQVWQATFR
mgnify:CR=1 FL=1